jgi:hypothetical protein
MDHCPFKKLSIARLIYHVSGVLLGLLVFGLAAFYCVIRSAWWELTIACLVFAWLDGSGD